MYFKIVVSSAVISAVIAAIGGIITTTITQRSTRKIAQETANQEIQKMERTWEREDVVSSDEEFAKMASLVSKYVLCANGAWDSEAIEAIAAIRSQENGRLGEIMDELYTCVQSDMYRKADKLLSDAIKEKRRIKTTINS